jgi:hypothetical protein
LGQERLLDFFLWSSIRRIQFDGDIKSIQVSIQRRAYNAPLQLAIVAAKRGNSQGSNLPFAVVPLKVFEASHDIGKTGDGTPVIFCREVEHPRREESPIEIWFTELDSIKESLSNSAL